ncbi:predicted protein [Neisseria gonorrhoeae SK-93-1035]|uniref:Uncharacterized protein n=1 Tax=Neisseria gonorrhoeae TaxID=485 RepID=A0AB74EN79_NEIGO|nr:predicted protein [Neisseria gonorrhoeae PID332]EEZ60256.1 predicted protein [Neisseria gonorrhoeae SK-93-1035]SCW09859.1 Predicted protein [Neisseria gonorrhoeae]SCW10376.1 Predicted protein [Neisseria gonorrhoeae]SCW10723.1 Predicted protein [Neisseria gonorrhoeae]
MDFDLCTHHLPILTFSQEQEAYPWVLNKPDSNNCFLLKWSLIIVRLTVPTSPVINYCKKI